MVTLLQLLFHLFANIKNKYREITMKIFNPYILVNIHLKYGFRDFSR